MAYGDKYFFEWHSVNEEVCRFTIQQKDWIGYDAIELQASETPCKLSSDAGDENILYPLRGQSVTASFINEGSIPITDFYTEDDRMFKGILTIDSETIFAGFMVLDDCSEDFFAYPHVISLSFNDGLGLLDSVAINVAAEGLPLANGRISIFDTLVAILAPIGLELPINFYSNVFEVSMQDRDDDPVNFPESQIFYSIFSYKDNNGTYKSCKEVLQDWLEVNDSVLFQERGMWNFVRLPELARFNNNPPGTLVDGSPYNAEAADFVTLNISGEGDLVPVEFTQTSSIRRGYKAVNRTYNYNPIPLINGADLNDLGTFIGTTVDGANTYNDYEFPADTIWEQQGQVGYIRIVTETASGRETDRYMVMEDDTVQSVNDMPSAAMVTQKIPVTSGDKLSFSCSFRANSDLNDNSFFGVCFYLRRCGASQFRRLGKTNNVDPATDVSTWQTYIPFSAFDPGVPPPGVIYKSIPPSVDKTDWQTFNVELITDPNDYGVAPFPFDSTLEIGFYGFNQWNNLQQGTRDAYIKDISLSIIPAGGTTNSNLSGQTHKAELNQDIKAILNEEIAFDDSTSRSNAGALFTGDDNCDALTADWKPQSGVSYDSYRFGEIQTIDRLLINQGVRTRIEGDFKWNTLPTFKNIFQFLYGGVEDRTFILSRGELDFKRCVLSGTFDEVNKDSDAVITDPSYTFTFKYKEAT